LASVLCDCSVDIKTFDLPNSAFELRDRNVDLVRGSKLSRLYRQRVCTFFCHSRTNRARRFAFPTVMHISCTKVVRPGVSPKHGLFP
jgi:hypothetical protein